MTQKLELVVTALQQRIGEIVSGYEAQIAILRAEITQLVNEKEQREKAAEDYSNELLEKINNVEKEG